MYVASYAWSEVLLRYATIGYIVPEYFRWPGAWMMWMPLHHAETGDVLLCRLPVPLVGFEVLCDSASWMECSFDVSRKSHRIESGHAKRPCSSFQAACAGWRSNHRLRRPYRDDRRAFLVPELGSSCGELHRVRFLPGGLDHRWPWSA